jgi:hypothetical protein
MDQSAGARGDPSEAVNTPAGTPSGHPCCSPTERSQIKSQ